MQQQPQTAANFATSLIDVPGIERHQTNQGEWIHDLYCFGDGCKVVARHHRANPCQALVSVQSGTSRLPMSDFGFSGNDKAELTTDELTGLLRSLARSHPKSILPNEFKRDGALEHITRIEDAMRRLSYFAPRIIMMQSDSRENVALLHPSSVARVPVLGNRLYLTDGSSKRTESSYEIAQAAFVIGIDVNEKSPFVNVSLWTASALSEAKKLKHLAGIVILPLPREVDLGNRKKTK